MVRLNLVNRFVLLRLSDNRVPDNFDAIRYFVIFLYRVVPDAPEYTPDRNRIIRFLMVRLNPVDKSAILRLSDNRIPDNFDAIRYL